MMTITLLSKCALVWVHRLYDLEGIEQFFGVVLMVKIIELDKVVVDRQKV